MPTYDFICNTCEKKFDIFQTFSEYGKVPVRCAHCGSDKVRRRMTKVRIAKSEGSRMTSVSDSVSNLDGLDEDPKALGQMMRKMGKEMGEELPPEFNEVVGRLEAGQSPEEIETALPDLGAGDSNEDE